jgi:dynein heavy chain
MMYQVGDLAVASPATVSRCGMVYLEPHQMGWQPLMRSWLNTLPSTIGGDNKKHLQGLFEWTVSGSLRCVRKFIKEISPTSDAPLVTCLMRTFDSLIYEIKTEEGANEVGKERMVKWIDAIFLFCLVWSIGSTGDTDGRAIFDKFIRELVVDIIPEGFDLVVPKVHESLKFPMFPSGTNGEFDVYDFVFDKPTCKWKNWVETIIPLEIAENASFDQLIIPTKDQQRYTFLLDKSIHHGTPLLMVGGTGTGKTIYINNHLLKGLSRELFGSLLVVLSARTSANMVQNQIDSSLDRRRRGVYGPMPGMKFIIFVDDLNMPQVCLLF